jgi:hypothetical protein
MQVGVCAVQAAIAALILATFAVAEANRLRNLFAAPTSRKSGSAQLTGLSHGRQRRLWSTIRRAAAE